MTDKFDTLNDLLMLDHDAVKAYTSAIDRIDIPYVKEKLIEFRGDHERHLRDLKSLITTMGGVPKDHGDFKGPFINAMTAVRSMMGNEQALKAMKGNEELTNRKYNEALKTSLPTEALAVVRKNRDDEARHLAFIEKVINEKVWEHAGTSVHP